MTGRTRFLACSLLAGVGLAFASVSVLAAPIQSDDLAVYAPGGVLEADDPVFDPGDCGTNCVVFVDALGDPTKVGKATVLTDPDGSVSDIFGVVDFSNNSFIVTITGCSPTVPGSCDYLGYSSAPGINAARFGDGTLFTTLPEGTGIFDATAYLNPGLQANNWTAVFTSDISDDRPTGVPEPGSLVLFGAGLLAMAAAFRKKGEVAH